MQSGQSDEQTSELSLPSSTASDHSVESHQKVRQVCWDRLPQYPLERIFSYLGHPDRSRSSAVCKSWAEAYESPLLWRCPVFRFNKTSHSKPRFCPKQVVKKYGKFFRRLTIMYKTPNCQNHKFVTKQLFELFQAMTDEGVQLESLRMPRLMILVDRSSRQLTCDRVANFLMMQKELSHVDFTNARMFRYPGLHVLESLVAEKVQHLLLHNFFELQFSGITSTERYLSTMGRFSALRTLALNYNYLSDEVMICIISCSQGHLEVFNVLCKKSENFTQIVSDECWVALKQKCPRMEVQFRLEVEQLRTDHIISSNILSPSIPLMSMQFCLSSAWTQEYDNRLFTYLTETFPYSLREAQFELDGFEESNVRKCLLQFLDKSPCLETFKIRIRFPHFDVIEFFEGMLQILFIHLMEKGEVSLKEFRATFQGVWPDGYGCTLYLQRTYGPRFREIGIAFKLKFRK